jgi:DNA replication protein DnaC
MENNFDSKPWLISRTVKPEHCLHCEGEVASFVINGQTLYAPLCSVCQTLVEEDEDLKRQERAMDEERYNSYVRHGIPKLFWKETFDTFEVNDRNRVAYDTLSSYARNFVVGTTNRNIIVLGNTGCGKSHLVCSLLKHVGHGRRMKV